MSFNLSSTPSLRSFQGCCPGPRTTAAPQSRTFFRNRPLQPEFHPSWQGVRGPLTVSASDRQGLQSSLALFASSHFCTRLLFRILAQRERTLGLPHAAVCRSDRWRVAGNRSANPVDGYIGLRCISASPSPHPILNPDLLALRPSLSIHTPQTTSTLLPQSKLYSVTMKAAVVLSFVAAAMAGLVERQGRCGGDNCARQVTGTRAGLTPIESRKADCSSFMTATVIPDATCVTSPPMLSSRLGASFTKDPYSHEAVPPPSPSPSTPTSPPSSSVPTVLSSALRLSSPPTSPPTLLLATTPWSTPLLARAGASPLPSPPALLPPRLSPSPPPSTTARTCRGLTRLCLNRHGVNGIRGNELHKIIRG